MRRCSKATGACTRATTSRSATTTWSRTDDRGEDEQERYSLVWEYSPIQFVQSRVGLRSYNGIPNFPVSNRDELFAELHVYF